MASKRRPPPPLAWVNGGGRSGVAQVLWLVTAAVSDSCISAHCDIITVAAVLSGRWREGHWDLVDRAMIKMGSKTDTERIVTLPCVAPCILVLLPVALGTKWLDNGSHLVAVQVPFSSFLCMQHHNRLWASMCLHLQAQTAPPRLLMAYDDASITANGTGIEHAAHAVVL
eukprot:scaffold284415_cov23-Tisochrysis_lutea.AAC.1